MNLTDLPRGKEAVVDSVDERSAADGIARRLRELGFVSGEPVRVVAYGPVAADPILVQIGFTRFALRRSEAARVRLRNGSAA
jgi:ferrous iron transport protein A